MTPPASKHISPCLLTVALLLGAAPAWAEDDQTLEPAAPISEGLPEATVEVTGDLDFEALESLGPAVFVAKTLFSAHLDFRQSKPRPYAATIATEHAHCFAGFGPPPVQIQEHYFRLSVDF